MALSFLTQRRARIHCNSTLLTIAEGEKTYVWIDFDDWTSQVCFDGQVHASNGGRLQHNETKRA